MTQPWNDNEFKKLAETYGGDLSRWPAHLQSAAGHHLASSLHAQRAIREAQALDDLLDLLPDAAPDSAWMQQLYQIPDHASQAAIIPLLPPKQRWFGGMALAASLAFGFMLGTTQVEQAKTTAASYLNDVLFGYSQL